MANWWETAPATEPTQAGWWHAAPVAEPAAAAAPKDVGNQHVDATTVFTDEMLGGLPGKAAAGVNALIRAPFTDKTIGEEYSTLRNQYQNAREQYADQNPVTNAVASTAGGVYGGVVTGGAAGEALGQALPAASRLLSSGYAGQMVGNAIGGAAQGAVSAYGHDEDMGKGAAVGLVAGGLAKPIISGGGALLNAAGGLIGVGNLSRAQSAIAQALSRSGKSADDVSNDLATAAAEGQPEYMLADSLGNSGQRMLTGIARSPGDMRQTIAKTIMDRQMDQGGRVASALQDATGTPLTAAQHVSQLQDQRAAQAAINYGPVERDATAIDVSAPVAVANRAISPAADNLANAQGTVATDLAARAPVEQGEASIRDPIRQTLKEARSYLASDTSTVTNVEKAFRAKTNIDQMINKATENGQGATVAALMPMQHSLDDALANTSSDYAAARDAYRTASAPIDAVETGRGLAAPRNRVADNLDTFNALPDDASRASARIGYFDPAIAKAESLNGSMSNAARPFTSNAAQVELPAFAAPGQGPLLMSRLGRENTMFDTGVAALGGSKTADNAADMADMQNFDPTMISAFTSGGIKGMALHGLTKAVVASQGRNQQTRDEIARMLLQSSPTQAAADLATAVAKGQKLTDTQNQLVKLLAAGGATQLPQVIGN